MGRGLSHELHLRQESRPRGRGLARLDSQDPRGALVLQVRAKGPRGEPCVAPKFCTYIRNVFNGTLLV